MKMKSTSLKLRRTFTRNAILLAIAALALSASPASRADADCACLTVWTGGTGDWFNQSNWSYLVPDCGGHCFISGKPIEADINNSGTAQITTSAPAAQACEVFLGRNAGDKGNLSVDHGTLNQCNEMWVGYEGKGTLSIRNGGIVTTPVGASIASRQNSSGAATVDGTNSQWTVTANGLFYVGGSINGEGGTGLLTVTNGGTFTTSGIVHVYKSGTLTGNGTVSTTSGTTIEGTLKPSGGRLTVSGNLSFAGTAPVMQCNVVPSSADNVDISGIASLGGRLSVTMTGTFTPGTTYTLLHAAAGRGNTFFLSVSITFPPGQGWNPVIIYDANNVKLNLASITGP